MYERYFNFTVKPFELVPNPDFLYLSKSHRKAITYLAYGVKERTGFMLLTGEVGAGKTTLIRHFIKSLDSTVPLSKVFNTKVNAEQLLAMINDDFGIESTGRDKVQLVKQLNDFLIEEYGKGRQALLIIDEAQNLSPEVLEEVRMLSNLETDNTKLLQILLVGQPELGKMLSATGLRQLRQRISIVCHLQTLNRKEMVDYIFHRLNLAGNRDALTFTEQAFDAIYAYSAGIPRLVNVIGNLLLLTAFTEGISEVDHQMVNEIVESLEPRSYYQPADTETDRKKALLQALGISPKVLESPADASESAFLPSKSGRVLKDICKRIESVEKAFSHMKASDLDTINRRMDCLERLYTQQAQKLGSLFNEYKKAVNGDTGRQALFQGEKGPRDLQNALLQGQALPLRKEEPKTPKTGERE